MRHVVSAEQLKGIGGEGEEGKIAFRWRLAQCSSSLPPLPPLIPRGYLPQAPSVARGLIRARDALSKTRFNEIKHFNFPQKPLRTAARRASRDGLSASWRSFPQRTQKPSEEMESGLSRSSGRKGEMSRAMDDGTEL
ncbi:hypothetical protein C0Q70_04769 [Pomacea canaliculata]|uniref:Uncharacterized protein n=1 Tax=Pomacea canaliculata TaxID=400727 RepID=A0A2T7PJA6_POMCA|nr:hypothetical protein C0Q70_04769 [Pomacea canaliculata]